MELRLLLCAGELAQTELLGWMEVSKMVVKSSRIYDYMITTMLVWPMVLWWLAVPCFCACPEPPGKQAYKAPRVTA